VDEDRPAARRRSLDQVEDVLVIPRLESCQRTRRTGPRASMARSPGCPKSTIGRIWRKFQPEAAPSRQSIVERSLFMDSRRPWSALPDPPSARCAIGDEKAGQIQALTSSQPVMPMMRASRRRSARLTCVRHHQPFRPRFNVSDGTVISAPSTSSTVAAGFKKFPGARIHAAFPADLDVHLICDNYGTHNTPRSTRGCTATPSSTCTSPRHSRDQPGQRWFRLPDLLR